MKVLLIFGGASPEHEVSIRSAKTIFNALSVNHQVFCAYITKDDVWMHVDSPEKIENGTELNYDPLQKTWKFGEESFQIDVAFPIVHGVGGEDGTLQNKLALWDVKFVGTPAEASEACFDKRATKELLRASGIDVVEEIVLLSTSDAPSFEKATEIVGGDVLFVKPSRSGSSVGVHKVKSQEDLDHALKDAFLYDRVVLIERAVSSPRELEMAVLETKPNVYEVSQPGEIVPDDDFYSYQAKYAETSESKTDVNPELSDELRQQLKDVSLKANTVLGCRGLVRVDFLYDGDREVLYLNEVNTLPGFTNISMYPMLWANSGIEINELIDKLVTVALSS
jgi:D-alanine-D-alanine ligase